MSPASRPLQFLLAALAGWIHQQQRDVIDYLQTENRASAGATRPPADAIHRRSTRPLGRES